MRGITPEGPVLFALLSDIAALWLKSDATPRHTQAIAITYL